LFQRIGQKGRWRRIVEKEEQTPDGKEEKNLKGEKSLQVEVWEELDFSGI